MMRSMYSGVSGLKTHQTKMDVIGNNIANVNTVAYKSMSITFNELMYQTTQKASGPNANTGGINARQIGLGVKSAAINTNITQQGATQTTNNPFDIQITGEAFFVVSNGQENFFTRDGSFYVDAVGNLCMTSNGYTVMGWGVDPDNPNQILQGDVQKLQIMSPQNMEYPPEATTKGYVSGIMDKNDPSVNSTSGKTINLTVYDSQGYPYTAKLNFKSTDDEGIYSLRFLALRDSNNEDVDISEVNFGSDKVVNRTTELTLGSNYQWNGGDLQDKAAGTTICQGATIKEYLNDADATLADPAKAEELQALADAYGYDSIEDLNNIMVSYTENNNNTPDTADDTLAYVSLLQVLANEQVTVTTNNAAANQNIQDVLGIADLNDPITANAEKFKGFTLEFDASTGLFKGIDGNSDVLNLDLSQITVETPAGASKFENVEIDFTNTTMFNNSGTATISATNGDVDGVGSGRKPGAMIGVSIDTSGRIYGTYDNGMTKLLGQIAVAEFANASGLEKQGDNLYSATLNSGEFDGIGVDITANGGYMNTGVLEMSNVDLSQEFTEMITTQRGFQANSRVITVSDTMLEELVNLKR